MIDSIDSHVADNPQRVQNFVQSHRVSSTHLSPATPTSSKMVSIGTLYLSEKAVATTKVSHVVVGTLGLS